MRSHRLGTSFILFALGTLLASAPLVTAATFTVTNTNDTGAGSLRQAIIDANADSIIDSIVFAIPEGSCTANGVCTITLASGLPDITEGVDIDATTQTRYGTAATNVCAAASSPSYMRVLVTSSTDFVFSSTAAGETTFRGLAISGGPSVIGIRIDSDAGTKVQCNHFGTDGPGTTPLEMSYGVTVAWWAAGGGNVTIGTDGDGVDDLAERNVFGGGGYGIYINTGNVLYPNRISGNFFGVGADGTTPINPGLGIYMRQGATQNLIGSDLNGTSDEFERNVFANLSTGMRIHGFLSSGGNNKVVGNWFGIDAHARPAPITGSAISLGSDGQNQEIHHNQILGNTIGIEVNGTATLAATSGQNCIVGNSTGLQHSGSEIDLDAEDNYWGAADGPSGIGSGSGDGILESGTGTVNFTPWLTSPATVCIVIFYDGFEGGDSSAWSSVVGLAP